MTEDRRGEKMRKMGAETRQKIVDYFKENPFSRNRECARDLGLSEMTVSRHVIEIRKKING